MCNKTVLIRNAYRYGYFFLSPSEPLLTYYYYNTERRSKYHIAYHVNANHQQKTMSKSVGRRGWGVAFAIEPVIIFTTMKFKYK